MDILVTEPWTGPAPFWTVELAADRLLGFTRAYSKFSLTVPRKREWTLWLALV